MNTLQLHFSGSYIIHMFVCAPTKTSLGHIVYHDVFKRCYLGHTKLIICFTDCSPSSNDPAGQKNHFSYN